jgi:hypothetical protein
MIEQPGRVYGRPPVEATDEELDDWIEAFIDAMLGPEEPGHLGARSRSSPSSSGSSY